VGFITAELSCDGTFIVVGIVNICCHLYAGYLQLCTRNYHISRVAYVLLQLFCDYNLLYLHVMLFPMLNVLYLYITTSRSSVQFSAIFFFYFVLSQTLLTFL